MTRMTGVEWVAERVYDETRTSVTTPAYFSLSLSLSLPATWVLARAGLVSYRKAMLAGVSHHVVWGGRPDS